MNNRLANAGGVQSFANRIQVNTDRDAYNYLLGRQKLPGTDENAINPNATISEGYLRSEVDLVQQNSVTFPITVNDGDGQQVTERRLKISQMFLVTQIGLFLYNHGTGSAADRAVATLHTYEATAVNTSGDMGVIYNSYLSARVDEVTYFDALDTLRFRRVGQAQVGVAGIVADQWDATNWGFYRLTPFIFFGGQSSNVVTLQLPTNIDLSTDTTTVVMEARGLLIQNAYRNKS